MPMLVLSSFFHVSLIACRKIVDGFTLDLIHHDSPLSPFHNPSNTPYERLQNALYRSFSRASFSKKKCTLLSLLTLVVTWHGHNVSLVLIASNNWDLFSIQKIVLLIKLLVVKINCQEVARVIYEDQSQSLGDLSIETFTFGENHVSIPNILFGCGNTNSGTLITNVPSGVIGLGGGSISIVSQMHHEIKGKFSYCLIPLELLLDSSNTTSHINFGDRAVVSDPDTVQFKSSPVGGGGHDQGNIIIDSGTMLTYVPDTFYLNLESTLMLSINATRKDDPSSSFGLCYESNENGTIDVPKIVAHFTNADLKLSTSNIFTQVEEGLIKAFTLMPMLVLSSFFHVSLIACRKSVDGFTLDLIHHYSPLSSFYNPSNTPFKRL
ncbi:hypothetical protein H5410_039695 [Solanum commersonii]|uniref:Peptidase A1 domain-containing protein n=1 Tax=Solanum commersonii TaxID=4109 RepID=A0A9J5XMV5_SOLCO|nr:hypothetical protein H5410_039695 [Solanum commersonii]